MTAVVSVVIPCHDYGRFLPACLDSVASQKLDLDSIEVVAIDDASSDDTWEVLTSYRDRLHLRAVRHDTVTGYVLAYRHGMSLATGRAVVPLDADDLILDSNALQKQLALLDARPRVAFVHSAYREIDASGRPLRERHPSRGTGLRTGRHVFERLLLGNYVQHTGTMIRRAAYDAVGGYDIKLANSIDWDLWLRLARRYDVGYVDRPMYAYRLHGANMHQRVSRRDTHDRTLAEIFLVIDRATAGEPPRLRARAYAEAHAMTAEFYFAERRLRDAVRKLLHAFRLDPSVVARPHFRSAVARGAAAAVLGDQGYARARAMYRRLRSG